MCIRDRSPALAASCKCAKPVRKAASKAGDLAYWQDTPEGCLALLILLDQYLCNAFRETREMYRADTQALSVTCHAQQQGFIARVRPSLRLFMLLPFAHSEALEDQDQSVALHRRNLPSGLQRAKRHRDIIAHFGRFPHRQPVYDRALTPEESQYLNTGGFQG